MSLIDFLIFIGVIICIPRLVEKHLTPIGFSIEVRIITILGGILWLFISSGHSLSYSILGIIDSDSSNFERMAYEITGEQLRSGNYKELIKYLFSPGRWFYVTYQGLFYYYTGGTVFSILVINAFMAFWGGLALTRLIYSFFRMSHYNGIILPIFIIFTPSVVFWSSANLKEALMFWSICQVFAFLRPAATNKKLFQNFIMTSLGIILGMLIRPHMMVIWMFGVFTIKLFQPRFWIYSLFLLPLAPIIFDQVSKKVNISSIDVSIEIAEKQMQGLIARGKQSTFSYGENGPIPVVSGLQSILFRPYFWKVKNSRSMLTSIEIWTISISIFLFWLRLRCDSIKRLLRNPAVKASLLVLIPFGLFFSFFPNEGLISRHRIQVFPALLILLATPILQKKFNIIERLKITGN